MTILGEHACPTCDQPVAVTSRNPNRRFCSPRCRAAHHRTHRHLPDRQRHDVPNGDPTNDVITTNDVRDGATNDVPNDVTLAHAVPAANGVQRCPHCRAELAVITVVVPATAAHVRTPEVIHMSPT